MFKSQEISDKFEQDGYVVLAGIEENVIDALRDLYNSTKGESGLTSNFYTSIWSENKNYKAKVDKNLKDLLSNFLDKHLLDYKKVFANFMVKKSGYSSSLQPHQDWTFVKEPESYSITVWIPLDDVTEENGALEVFPRSQNLNNYVRARFMDSPFAKETTLIEESFMKSIPLKKGEALLINSRTIHASPDNLSGYDRIAASVVVCPSSASLIHYVYQEDGTIDYLEIDEDFFINYSCFEFPLNEKLVSKKQHIFNEIVRNELEKI